MAFAGRDEKTLFALVFYGPLGTRSAGNRVIAIPTIAEGYVDERSSPSRLHLLTNE